MKSILRFYSTSFLLALFGFFLVGYPQISSAANVSVPNVVNQTTPFAIQGCSMLLN